MARGVGVLGLVAALATLVVFGWGCGGSDDTAGTGRASANPSGFGDPEGAGSGAAGSFNNGAAASGGTQSGAGGSGPTINPEDPNCGSATITPVVDISPGNILVVFDRSGSMDDMDFNGMRRFDAANNALLAAVDRYICPAVQNPDGTPCAEPLTLGTVLFPTGLSLLCDPVGDFNGPDQISWRSASEWLTTWNAYWAANQLGLGTPIEHAFIEADRVVRAAVNDLPGNTAVLFLTDGGSTCFGITPDAVSLAGQWAGIGVNTYVVSVQPGGSPFNDMVAAAGGTGTSINPSNQQELDDAMANVMKATAQVASCDITLDGGLLADLEGACQRGTVILGPNVLECDPVNGFQVTGMGSMTLNGTACDALKGGAALSATFPCDVILE